MAKEKIKSDKMKEKKKETEEGSIAAAICNDKKCPLHGNLKTRGRTFRGYVVRINDKRLVVESERVAFIHKYERYEKRKTRIHAHLPDCMASNIKIGDSVLVAECRPLSKMIHHVLILEGEKK